MRTHKQIKIIFTILGLFVFIGMVFAVKFYYENLRGVGPAIGKPSQDSTELIPSAGQPQNTTGMPLKLPAGFSVSIFAKNLTGARVMAFDAEGNMWVSQTGEGKITKLVVQNGKVISQQAEFKNLNKPHGLAFDPDNSKVLYFAEQTKISKIEIGSGKAAQKIADLPGGGGHFTRTIGFGPDGRLYVATGSSCNVCNEKDERRSAIYSMNKDGSDFKVFAKGLRNTPFFTWNKEGKMFGTEMGRDYLGDNLPPDEVNVIEDGKNYGWPICYGKKIHDTNFDKNQYIRDPCADTIAPLVEIQAHSAPLGLTFIPSPPVGAWPKEYQNNLLVAFHGSWNRTQPTGYKIAQIKFDGNGNYVTTEDFISGWLPEGEKGKGSDISLGRPVDLIFDQKGNLYISDDKAGVIYKVEYLGN